MELGKQWNCRYSCCSEIWIFWLQSHREHEDFRWLTNLSPIVHWNALRSEKPQVDGTKGLQFHRGCPVFGLASVGRSCLSKLKALCANIKTALTSQVLTSLWQHFQQNVPVQGSLQWYSFPQAEIFSALWENHRPLPPETAGRIELRPHRRLSSLER